MVTNSERVNTHPSHLYTWVRLCAFYAKIRNVGWRDILSLPVRNSEIGIEWAEYAFNE